MIGLTLSPRDRRTLIVGSATIAVIFIGGNGAPALRRWEAAQVAAASATRDSLDVSSRGERGARAVRDSLGAREWQLQSFTSKLLSATTADGAAGALAARLEELARRAGVEVHTVTLRPDTITRFGLARVAVRVNAEGDVRGLIDLLFAVESNSLPLAVRELAISQNDPAAPESEMETLRVELVVATLARISPPAPRPRS